MKRVSYTVLLALLLFYSGEQRFGMRFYLFCDSLFTVFPWLVASLAALSYPFFNYVDGIAKDASALSTENEHGFRKFSDAIDRLKREIVANVVLALSCFLLQVLLISAVTHLGLLKAVAYPLGFALLGLAVSAFYAQAIGFKTAANLRGLVMRRGKS